MSHSGLPAHICTPRTLAREYPSYYRKVRLVFELRDISNARAILPFKS